MNARQPLITRLAAALAGTVTPDDAIELPGAIIRETFRGEVLLETTRGSQHVGWHSDGAEKLAAVIAPLLVPVGGAA